MNRKRYVVEVWGEEVVKHKRLLIVEVPDGTSIDEIEALNMGVFDDVPEPPAWEHDDSDGIYGCDAYVPEVQREAFDTQPTHCKLVRDADGDLVLEVSGDD